MARQHHQSQTRCAYKVDVAELVEFTGLGNHTAPAYSDALVDCPIFCAGG